jgi:hypothetical protein
MVPHRLVMWSFAVFDLESSPNEKKELRGHVAWTLCESKKGFQISISNACWHLSRRWLHWAG